MSFLLLQIGDKLLLQNGDGLLLQAGGGGGGTLLPQLHQQLSLSGGCL